MRGRLNVHSRGQSCLADSVVVARAQDGDAYTHEVLFRHYYPFLLRYIRMHGSYHNPDAEDLCQEVMLTAFRKIHVFDRNRPFVSWLKGIAKNHLCGAWRSSEYVAAHTSEISIEDVHIGAGEHASSIDEEVVIHDCLEELPVSQREALIGNCLLGFSCRQLAHRAGVSVHAMEKRAVRAKREFLRLYSTKGHANAPSAASQSH